MSFPGTYNISYYYGDTLELTRGAALEDQIFAYAQVSSDNTYIACAIRPEDAANMSPTTSYVYDIEIAKTSDQSSTPYDIVYTLLTGTLSITQDVTKPGSDPLPERPLGATGLTLESSTFSTLEVSWTAPTSGGTPTAYKVAIIPFTTNQGDLENAIDISLVTTNQTSYTFFGLAENTNYSVIILPTNSAGDAIDENLLTNASAFTTADNPLTIEPDFVVTNEGSGAYLIDGVSNDTITLIRGETYVFEINASGHPFWIQDSPAPYDEYDVYNTGITNNGTDEGVLLWTVAENAPNTLFYVCQFHSSMSGTITIIDGES